MQCGGSGFRLCVGVLRTVIPTSAPFRDLDATCVQTVVGIQPS